MLNLSRWRTCWRGTREGNSGVTRQQLQGRRRRTVDRNQSTGLLFGAREEQWMRKDCTWDRGKQT